VCNCADLDDIVSCGDNEEEEFIRPKLLRLLKEKPDGRLFVCPECDTCWHVDHMQRGPLAIKIQEPFGWESFDDRPLRLKYMVRFHGGYGEEQCRWRGCGNKVLKGMALCAHHAFPEFGGLNCP
jgi:hypothetical protein